MQKLTTIQWLKVSILCYKRRTPSEQELLNQKLQDQLSKALERIHDLEINRNSLVNRIHELESQTASLRTKVESLSHKIEFEFPIIQKEVRRVKSDLRDVDREVNCHGLDLQLDAELISNIIGDLIEIKVKGE